MVQSRCSSSSLIIKQACTLMTCHDGSRVSATVRPLACRPAASPPPAERARAPGGLGVFRAIWVSFPRAPQPTQPAIPYPSSSPTPTSDPSASNPHTPRPPPHHPFPLTINMVFLRASRAAFRAAPSTRGVSTSSLMVGQNRPSLLLNNGARQMLAARNASSDDGSVTVSRHRSMGRATMGQAWGTSFE